MASKTPKRPADYAKLADETELIRDGLKSHVDAAKAQLNELLKDVPKRAAIVQIMERHANRAAQLYEVQARLDRYVALRDREPESPNGGDS